MSVLSFFFFGLGLIMYSGSCIHRGRYFFLIKWNGYGQHSSSTYFLCLSPKQFWHTSTSLSVRSELQSAQLVCAAGWSPAAVDGDVVAAAEDFCPDFLFLDLLVLPRGVFLSVRRALALSLDEELALLSLPDAAACAPFKASLETCPFPRWPFDRCPLLAVPAAAAPALWREWPFERDRRCESFRRLRTPFTADPPLAQAMMQWRWPTQLHNTRRGGEKTPPTTKQTAATLLSRSLETKTGRRPVRECWMSSNFSDRLQNGPSAKLCSSANVPVVCFSLWFDSSALLAR